MPARERGAKCEVQAPTHDQQRALHAYKCVGAVKQSEQKDYRNAVNGLGATILRSGLAAAMALLERLGDRGERLLEDLAGAKVPGLEGAAKHDLPNRVRALGVAAYMTATRETLETAAWLKRAAQATFGVD